MIKEFQVCSGVATTLIALSLFYGLFDLRLCGTRQSEHTTPIKSNKAESRNGHKMNQQYDCSYPGEYFFFRKIQFLSIFKTQCHKSCPRFQICYCPITFVFLTVFVFKNQEITLTPSINLRGSQR